MPETDIRICFVGDSFVNGTGDETALGWTGRLCVSASARGIPVTCYDLGVRRDTTAEILRRCENECIPRLPAGCDGRVVVSCGVNDAAIENGRPRIDPSASCANLRELLEVTARKYKLLVVGPPPIDDDAQNDGIGKLSQSFARIASSLEVPYIDLFSRLVDNEDYRSELAASDGAHPRSTGYEMIARIVAASPDWWFSEPDSGDA